MVVLSLGVIVVSDVLGIPVNIYRASQNAEREKCDLHGGCLLATYCLRAFFFLLTMNGGIL